MARSPIDNATKLLSEDIELKITLSDNVLTIMADVTKVEQVLMNLAANSRDAMPNGGVLSISTEPAEIDNKGYALISISDTGTGMDEETKRKIFEPFFTTKKHGKGTGLGLSIVYGIIRQHNGNIYVHSKPGAGTTFKIFLPLTDEMVKIKEFKELPVYEKGTETILVAEDERHIREFAASFLKDLGYSVIAAEDGEDALNKFLENKNEIHLALLDMVMPKKNGRDVYERIRRIKPSVKVLFMSGYTTDMLERKGIFKESLNFISKPFLPHELMEKIREVLGRNTV